MRSTKREPIGADYWRNVSRDQEHLAAALTADFRPLRAVIEQRNKDAAASVSAHVRWEKLTLLGLLEVDRRRFDNVYVKRGPQWGAWWEKAGVGITRGQLSMHDFAAELERAWQESGSSI